MTSGLNGAGETSSRHFLHVKCLEMGPTGRAGLFFRFQRDRVPHKGNDESKRGFLYPPVFERTQEGRKVRFSFFKRLHKPVFSAKIPTRKLRAFFVKKARDTISSVWFGQDSRKTNSPHKVEGGGKGPRFNGEGSVLISRREEAAEGRRFFRFHRNCKKVAPLVAKRVFASSPERKGDEALGGGERHPLEGPGPVGSTLVPHQMIAPRTRGEHITTP